MARHTRHAASARAAVWRCPQCQRRQNYKHACRYCHTPRDASTTTTTPSTHERDHGRRAPRKGEP
jgi:hypothetical protein